MTVISSATTSVQASLRASYFFFFFCFSFFSLFFFPDALLPINDSHFIGLESIGVIFSGLCDPKSSPGQGGPRFSQALRRTLLSGRMSIIAEWELVAISESRLCLHTKCSPPSLRVKFVLENKEGAQAWTFGFQAQGPPSRPHLNFLWISPAYHAAGRGKKEAIPSWACPASDSLEASPQILLHAKAEAL